MGLVHHREGSCSSQYSLRLLRGNRYGGVLVNMFENALKLAHVVVATLYDIKLMLGIKLKSESKITSRFLAVGVGQIWLTRISMGKEDVKF